MKAEIRPHIPAARCHKCGAPEPEMVCHHCGNAMCAVDGQNAVLRTTNVPSREFAELNLDEVLGRTKASDSQRWEVHCDDCRHVSASYSWMMPLGWLAAGIALLMLWGGASVGGVVLLIGLASVGGGWWLENKRKTADGEHLRRLGVPLSPRVSTLLVRDSMQGRLRLDKSGQYHSEVQSLSGSILTRLMFDQKDRERCEAYRRRFRSKPEDDLPFHAGFIVLHGPANLRLSDSGLFLPDRIKVAALTGKTSQFPYLASSDHKGERTWTLEWRYDHVPASHRAEDGPVLPLSIVPFLTEGAERKAIDLELLLNPASGVFEGVKIEALELMVPTRVGRISDVQPNAIITPSMRDETTGEACQQIAWRHFSFTKDEVRAGRKLLHVRFDADISPQLKLHGRIVAVLAGSLSGLKEVRLFYPWGRRRPDRTTHSTAIEIPFELELASLGYQEMVTLSKELSYRNVAPSHALVTDLVDALTQDGLYVKRVVENPPRTSRWGAHVLSRYWDLAGRMYDGVYPVDWHVVVTGEEARWQAGKEPPGSVQFMLSLQADASNDSMKRLAENLQSRIESLIADTVNAASG